MAEIVEVDSLEVLVLVDNSTDSLSSNPRDVLPEWSGLVYRGKTAHLVGTEHLLRASRPLATDRLEFRSQDAS